MALAKLNGSQHKTKVKNLGRSDGVGIRDRLLEYIEYTVKLANKKSIQFNGNGPRRAVYRKR